MASIWVSTGGIENLKISTAAYMRDKTEEKKNFFGAITISDHFWNSCKHLIAFKCH